MDTSYMQVTSHVHDVRLLHLVLAEKWKHLKQIFEKLN